jgi:GINS complex subunit 2
MEQDLTPAECEFFAEASLIEIVPNFRMDTLSFISGNFGPFVPGVALRVPLWLAIYLKKRQRCLIVAPGWLDLATLRDKIEEETKSEGLTQFEYHYMEVASLLLAHAHDDIRRKKLLRASLEDFYNIRLNKLQKGLSSLKPTDKSVNLTNICAIELQSVRRLLPFALNTLTKLEAAD